MLSKMIQLPPNPPVFTMVHALCDNPAPSDYRAGLPAEAVISEWNEAFRWYRSRLDAEPCPGVARCGYDAGASDVPRVFARRSSPTSSGHAPRPFRLQPGAWPLCSGRGPMARVFSGFAEVDLVGDDVEVLGVVGQQWDAVDVGGGGDREVECSSAWSSTALRDEACSRPHSRAAAASNGSASKWSSMVPRRRIRRARVSSSRAMSTPKWSSVSETTLMAASSSGPSRCDQDGGVEQDGHLRWLPRGL